MPGSRTARPLSARRQYRRAWIPGLLLLLLVTSASCSRGETATPLVFAAASLADVLADQSAAFEAQGGGPIDFNFGGSNALATQMSRLAAPGDGIILAGTEPMDRLVATGTVDRETVVFIAENSLVVVASSDRRLDSLKQLADSESKIVIADPALAPAGLYARQALEAEGTWERLRDRIVPTLDVRAALAAVEARSADYGVVYATDAATAPGLTVVLEIDGSLHETIRYPAAVATDSPRSAAIKAFFEFLTGPTGRQIFEAHGFRGP